MHPVRRLSVADQVAEHLREGLRGGRWGSALPGVMRLAAELDVSAKTMRAALRQLEADGLLDPQGRGRSRRITQVAATQRSLRVGMLLFEPLHKDQPESAQLVGEVQQSLEAAGHELFFLEKTQVELNHDVSRLARHLRKARADAWIVVAGSRSLLEWFAGQPTPCLALFGRADGLPLARTGPDKLPAVMAATRQLLGLGHRLITMIVRRPRREPVPGNIESAFLAELAAHGIKTGGYNLPDWEETPQGLAVLLERLFRVTPPTALLIDETPLLIATSQFLARRNLRVPEQVSLVSSEHDAWLGWCYPSIAHIQWKRDPIVRRIVRWVAAVRSGHADRKTINFPAQFIAGGSLGPPPGGLAGPSRGGELGQYVP